MTVATRRASPPARADVTMRTAGDHPPTAESHDDSAARPASHELAGRASSGLRWGAFNQGTQQVVRLGVQIVLTKLLAPSDFGAMTLALVVINIGSLVGALGFAQVLVQRHNITRRHVA